MSYPLQTKDFNYDLPLELIAQNPVQRGSSRMLVSSFDGHYQDTKVSELVRYIPEGSLVIFNDTKVFASRLHGVLDCGKVAEIFLLRVEEKEEGLVHCEAIGKPLKKIRQSTHIKFGSLAAKISFDETTDSSVILLDFVGVSYHDFFLWLEKYGQVPLPPYIKRPEAKTFAESPDSLTYQTVYARERGSVAAPTAGLHFTKEMLQALESKGIETAHVTLHVGLGTFSPVHAVEMKDHHMHDEIFMMPKKTLEKIWKANAEKRNIVLVGTTTLRTLEGFYLLYQGDARCMLAHTDEWLHTNIFIYPHSSSDVYKPWACTHLLTNFHQPHSTLLMLVSALIGFEKRKALYDHALQEKYRFLSYGDCCFLSLI